MNKSATQTIERLTTKNDLPDLLLIEQSAFPMERWASETTLARRLEFPDSGNWISFIENLPVGFANGFPIKDLKTQGELDPPDSELYKRGGKVWLLRNIAVKPSYQRMGVGRNLIERQLETAKAYGAHWFRLTATENLTDFFRNLGFTLIRKARVIPWGTTSCMGEIALK